MAAKTVKVYKIVNGVKKLQDMQESVWLTLVKGGIPMPEGVTYELAPKPEVKTVELMPKAEALDAALGAMGERVEAPKVEAPKVEAPKVEAPKVEAPKVEAPKVVKPKNVKK